jgi:hypothetical protein
MVTTVITPASDKVQFFAGVFSPVAAAGTRVLLESSTNLDAVNGGVIAFYQGAVAPWTFRWRSKGTAQGEAAWASYPADVKHRITGLGDIAGDSAILRVGGTQVASSAADQWTGNFQAHQIFIGVRTGILWGGRIYSLALRFGPNLTAGQITDMEGWVNTTLNP